MAHGATPPDPGISITKTCAPNCSGIVPRKRLFRILDNYGSHPITWVYAPAGSGKTSLIASYLRTTGNNVLWYRVDGGDADIATFFYYLGWAVRKLSPRRKKSLPLLTPEYLQIIPTFARCFFEQMYQLIGEGGVMVLDDYQEAPRESELHGVMSVALSVVPESVRVIIISRRAPPPKFSRLTAHERMVVLGWRDLKLEETESREIARLRLGERYSIALARMLHKTADGWAAGLVMLITAARCSDPNQGNVKTPREVFDYFANEVFERMSPEMQNLLLSIALFPTMNASMARELTGIPDAAEMLASLSGMGCFAVEHDMNDPVYGFHPLFQQFLLARSVKTFSSDMIDDLRRRAALLLEEAGESERAILLLLEAGAWETLKPLMLRQAPILASQGRIRTLEDWLQAIPGEFFDAEGWFIYWLGICRLPFDLKESRSKLELAFARFEADGDMKGRMLAWSGIVDAIFNAWDDLASLDSWIKWGDDHLSIPLDLPEIELEAAVTTSMLNALFSRQPHHPGLRKWMLEGQRIFAKSPDSPSGFRVGTCLLICYGWLGKSTLKDDIARQMESVASSPHMSTLAILTYKWAVAGTGTSLSDSAGISAREGLAIAHATGIHCMDFIFNGLCASESLSAGDTVSAAASLDRMVNGMRGRSGRAFYHYMYSWYAYLCGNFPDALGNAEHAVRLSVESGSPIPEALCRLAYADLLVEIENFSQAHDHTAVARRIAEAANNSFLLFMSGLTETRLRLADRKGSPDEALPWLWKAMTVGRDNCYMNFRWWVPARMAELCLKALEAGIEREYARSMILTRNLMPEPLPYHCEDWPWKVRIFTMGRFEIRRDDKVVRFPAKAPRRVLLLLKALVAAGPEGADEESLADFLWPESDGDAAHGSMAISIHRLRQLLRADGAIDLRDAHISINPRVCWVDVNAFEALLEQTGKHPWQGGASPPPESTDVPEAVRMMEYALSLYKGPFLEEIDESWAVSSRERLRSSFLKAVVRMGANLEAEGEFDLAASWYERGLDVDDLAEPLYRSLIELHLALGRKAEALTAYRRCKRTLRAKFGVDASPETEALIKTVTSEK